MAHIEDQQWRLGTTLHQFGHLLESGLMSDCTIVVGKDGGTQNFLSHKLVLSRASAVFCAMFYGGLQEEGSVRVTDIDPEPFKKMLQYIYTEEFSIEDLEMAAAVCYAANKYQIINLINKCINFMKSVMLPRHVLKCLELARLISNVELERSCIQRLQAQTQEIISADTWVEANLSSVLTVLQQELLNIKCEASLLKACIRWGTHRSRLRNLFRELVAPALKLIRLRNLTPQEFIKYIYPTKIFDDKENLDIILCLESSEYEVPDIFSNISTRRASPVVVRTMLNYYEEVIFNDNQDDSNPERSRNVHRRHEASSHHSDNEYRRGASSSRYRNVDASRRVEDGARTNRNRRQESRIQRGACPYEREEPHRIDEVIGD